LPVNKILPQNRPKHTQILICVENTLALRRKKEMPGS